MYKIRVYDPDVLIKKLNYTIDTLVDRIRYVSADDFRSLIERNIKFFVAEDNDKIIGMAKFTQNPWNKKIWWIQYLSVDPKYQNQKIASAIADSIFAYSAKKRITVETSSYSKQGFKKLKPLFNKLAGKYKVEFIDKDLGFEHVSMREFYS